MKLPRRELRSDTSSQLKISALSLMSQEFSIGSRPGVVVGSPSSFGSGASRGGTLLWESSGPSSGLDKRSRLTSTPRDEDDSLFLAPIHPDSFRSAMQLCVTIGQFFSMLPTSNKLGTIPRFYFLSLRVMFWTFITSGLLLNGLLTILETIGEDPGGENTITMSSRWVFYLSAVTVSILYFRLAMQWRCLCFCFLRTEHRMQDMGYPPRLRLRLRTITVIVLSLALIEYSLAISSGLVAMDFKNRSFGQFWKDYFHGNYAHLLLVFNYNPILLIFAQYINTVATFMWNYNDLFVMLASVSIAQRFRLLNAQLYGRPQKEKTEKFWKNARENYNALSILTREIDEILSVQILFSFMNNLYFICIQLLHTVKHEENSLLKNIYFVFSFGFLLLRTVFVSLFAASINDESRNVKQVLYSVSSRSFCEEVDRFIVQATTDEISLTGMKFFNVTRSFLLTMAGTIATYEVVLVQFNGSKKSA